MKKIMLVCAAGMSTSLLVRNMELIRDQQGLAIDIFAKPESEAISIIEQCDVILLGPQVNYVYEKFNLIGQKNNVPVKMIPTLEYATMDGKKVLSLALDLMEETNEFNSY